MAKTMTPSVERNAMTDGQIDKAVDAYRSMLRKHRNELGSEAAQHVLGSDDYVNEQVGVLHRRVEAASDLIIRHVKVDRGRTPQEAFKGRECTHCLNDGVVAAMPHGEGEKADVYFFRVGRPISNADLEKEYELRGLKSADPYSQAAVNEDDPSFADNHPNGTYWKDGDGKWCYATFYQWFSERGVCVDHRNGGWDGDWWFAGLRK